jgi:hypothetical protein
VARDKINIHMKLSSKILGMVMVAGTAGLASESKAATRAAGMERTRQPSEFMSKDETKRPAPPKPKPKPEEQNPNVPKRPLPPVLECGPCGLG